MEENFGSKEALIPNVNAERLIVDGVFTLELFDPLGRIAVIFVEFFGNVRTDVTEFLWTGTNGKVSFICTINCKYK